MIAEVIIQSNVKNLNKTFDYKIPTEYEENSMELIGARVLVPFGRMKSLEEGFIVNIKKSTDYDVKEIAKVEEKYARFTCKYIRIASPTSYQDKTPERTTFSGCLSRISGYADGVASATPPSFCGTIAPPLLVFLIRTFLLPLLINFC